VADRTESLRTELFYGAVAGLGLSAAFWGAALHPPAEPEVLAFAVLAGLAGTLTVPLPRVGRVPLAYGAALSAMLLHGLGAALLTAALTVLFSGPMLRSAERKAGRRGAMFDLGRVELLTFLGGTIYLALGGTIAPAFTPRLLLFVGGSALAVLAMDVALARAEASCTPRSRPGRALTQRLPLRSMGALLGSAAALGFVELYSHQSMRVWLLAGPLVYVVYLLGRARAERLTRRGRRVRGAADLQQSIARLLSRAIASGNEAAERRLWRVQRVCVAVGERLELREKELDALASAALLHDVGKLSVPELILSKPGRLDEHEMEQIRIHPVLGAEIVRRIGFPARVECVVRHHHERWDGRGYPDGLEEDEIPIGARVLAAVDCYDALISDRPFRRAVAPHEARSYLRTESDAMFDPLVVDALLECLDENGDALLRDSSTADVRPTTSAEDETEEVVRFRFPSAQRHLEALEAIARAARLPLQLDDCLTLVAERLASIVPHRSLVLYVLDEDRRQLRSAFSCGQGARALRRVTIPAGERLSGWAVLHQRSIVGQTHTAPLERDGSRSDLEDHQDDPEIDELRSALTAPLVVDQQSLGALTLYDVADREFDEEERLALVHAAGHVAQAVRRGGRSAPSEQVALTDELTGLPNASYFWREAEQMIPVEEDGRPFGVLAFRVRGLSEINERWGVELAEQGLCRIARRLARTCGDAETVVRFGPDLFVVLASMDHESELVGHWTRFVDAVDQEPLGLPFEASNRLRMITAHASYPTDGNDLDALLGELESRLGLAVEHGRSIVPFRASRTA